MADRRRRTAQEREADRRARAARRTGRPSEPAPGFDDAPTTPPAPERSPADALDPPPSPRQPREAPETPPALGDQPPLVQPRVPGAAPIKSFPSAPDPDFYVPDDELEVPAGTRRVSRLAARGPQRPRPVKRRRPPKRHRWRGRIASLAALLLAAALIWFLIELFEPFGTSAHGRVTVKIPASSSSSRVGKQLAADGVISSSFFFELRATLAGDRGDIRPGTYHLQKGMSYGSVLSKLTARPKAARVISLTIAEGHTRRQVDALLRKQKIKGSYLAATRHSRLLDPTTYGAPRQTSTLEGFLFPDTFSLLVPVKISDLVADQLRDFKRRFATVNLGFAHSRHLSDYNVLTVASLIEAEAASQRDRPLVASVIYNRLHDHMMLQLDSTARYATGNLTKPLTGSELKSPSPYNTHTHFGLPPTPIDSPGLAAIDAAAHPARSPYLYFFSKPCTDRTVFATNYAQFQSLLVRDRRNHCG